MGGLEYSAGQYFCTLLSVLLLVLVAQSFGLLIGAIIPNPKTAQVRFCLHAFLKVLSTQPQWPQLISDSVLCRL